VSCFPALQDMSGNPPWWLSAGPLFETERGTQRASYGHERSVICVIAFMLICTKFQGDMYEPHTEGRAEID
jgi:hypothetical protein